MAYFIKGARAIGTLGDDPDWGSIVNAVVTPQNVQAGAQAGSGLLQTIMSTVTGATGLGPRQPAPPPGPSTGMSTTTMVLIAGGIALATAGAYLVLKK